MSEQTYRQILRSTTIIGGSSAVNIALRVIAAKLTALLLGPNGVGLIGVFNAAIGVASSIAGMGIASSSGVRTMAEASANADADWVVSVAVTLRRVSLVLGIAGSLAFFALREPISRLTFGNPGYAIALGILAPAVGMNVISAMQTAFLRGMRRIGDLARVTILGLALGTLLGMPVLYIWRQAGITPYLVILSGMTLAVSWHYARKVRIRPMTVAWKESLRLARGMFSLGVSFMLAGLTTTATTYLIKTLITRQMGLQALGYYEAASALANVYVGFILGAMGTDFFPHLSSVIRDRAKSAELINAQVEIGVLIAAPGILVVLTLGSFVLTLLYSADFTPAFEILRWQALGTFLRVASWPLGYILLAQGRGGWFLGTELSANLVYLGLLWGLTPRFGLAGIGGAFFGMYVYCVLLMIFSARRLLGFDYSRRNRALLLLLMPILLGCAILFHWLSSAPRLVIGLTFAALLGGYSLYSLLRLPGAAQLPVVLARLRKDRRE